ncbi:MAG TPA: hypothetical protein ENJ18_15610 [Nannocystis exedens]|nr:hypothetical protein [Nannocystis exedens]
MVGVDLETGDVMLDCGIPGFGVEVEVAEFVLSTGTYGFVFGLAAVLEGLAGGFGVVFCEQCEAAIKVDLGAFAEGLLGGGIGE